MPLLKNTYLCTYRSHLQSPRPITNVDLCATSRGRVASASLHRTKRYSYRNFFFQCPLAVGHGLICKYYYFPSQFPKNWS